MTHAIGLDVGTTNVKAVLVDDDGAILARSTRALTTLVTDETAEQDAEAIWTAVVDAMRDLGAAHPLADVTAIGIDSQYSSTVPVRADGTPAGPCILYSDHRGTEHCHAIFGRHEAAFMTWIEHHGIPPVGNGLSLAHVLHLQHDQPEVHAETAAYLEVMDYVAARLTGRIAASQCTMFTTQLCDNRTIGVIDYDADLVAMSGVDPTRLPPLDPPRGVRGEVRADVAELCGLPRGVTVAVPLNDSQAGAFATGAAVEGRVGLMIGTTAVLLDVADGKAADYDRELLTMPAPDGNLVWAENGFAGRVVAHVLETLIHADDALAAHAVDDAFVNLDAALDASEPGAGGVLFLPWLAGSMSPAIDHQMRGGFLGLSLTTTRTDLVRAAVEGTAHNLAWLLRAVEQFTGHATDEIVFGGGAARSGGWAQVIADVVGRPVRPLAEPAHGVARASAELALGHAPDRLVHLDSRVHEPRAAVHERATAQQVRFEAVFEALRPIWHADPTAPSTADRNEP